MAKYLLDDNIPARISAFNHPDFTSAAEVGIGHSDSLIWAYARVHDLVIVSKDFDFRYRILQEGPPPRVVHIQCGNLRIRDFRDLIEGQWATVSELVKHHSLVVLTREAVVGVI